MLRLSAGITYNDRGKCAVANDVRRRWDDEANFI